MAQMNISNTLFNDTKAGVIAYVEQLKDRLLKNYIATLSQKDQGRIPADIKSELGVLQERLNEFFIKHWVDFQSFLLDEGVDPTTIDSWHEVQEFLEGLPNDEAMWLKNKLTQLDNRITAMDIPDGGAYDVSADHVDGEGNYAVYVDLSAALNAIPSEKQKPGMSIRFIQGNSVDSSDNKYVQYRLMSTAWSTNVSNWQGVDDEPTIGSDNLVKSGGVRKVIGSNENIVIQNSGLTSIGVGYPLIENGKAKLNETDQTSSNYENRQTFLLDVEQYCIGEIVFRCKSYTNVLCLVFADSLLNVLSSTIASTIYYADYSFDSLPTGTKYVLISEDKTIVNGYFTLKPTGLLHNVEKYDEQIGTLAENVLELNSDVSDVEQDIKACESDINGLPDLTVNSTNAIVLGQGFIKKDGNTILDETDQTTTGWNNRKVLKYDLSSYRRGKGEYKIKGTSTSGLLYYAITDKNNTILSSQEDNSGVQGKIFEGILDIQKDAKYIYFCDDYTSNNSYVIFSKEGLYDNVEELQSKQAITENSVNGLTNIMKGADTVTIDANNATILGRGYIKTDDGKAVDEVDNTSSGYKNRKVLKYNVSSYVGGTIQIKCKSDNGFLQYALVDSDLNILSSHTSTAAGQFFQGTIDVPLDAFAIYIGDDYSQNQAFAILTNAGIYETIKDIQQKIDYSRYNLLEEWFTVRVNSTRPVSELTDDYDYNTDGETYYDDNCYIGFPDNVKADTKLIIMFHGGGEAVGTDAASMNTFNYSCVAKTYRALGYAVLMTNGMPDLWAQEKGLENSSAPIGNWMALESTIKAYQYVTEKYPCIDQKGCYLWATSQGGMVAENFVELCDIPVRACCYQAPALSMRYVQLYLTYRTPWMEALYGFNSIATYSKEKCLGLDPFVRNVDTDIPIVGTTFAEIAQTDVSAITSKKFRKGVPLLILHGTADTAVSPVITQAYIKAINNAGGCMAKYKLFEGVGHGVASPTTQSYQGTTSYSMTGYSPKPLYTTAGILEFAKWYYRYGGYPIPSGVWGNAIQ